MACLPVGRRAHSRPDNGTMIHRGVVGADCFFVRPVKQAVTLLSPLWYSSTQGHGKVAFTQIEVA